ncbi:50S ribosomal protein L35 [Candidatus Microgenomates bacterium]|nr:50S ribosomal protein L35 [Candidatus Microgenomates bacterium]
MPKLKSKDAVQKRFRLTKSGKLIRRGQNHRHLAGAKSKNQQRRMDEPQTVYKGFAKKLKRLL